MNTIFFNQFLEVQLWEKIDRPCFGLVENMNEWISNESGFYAYFKPKRCFENNMNFKNVIVSLLSSLNFYHELRPYIFR